MFELPVVVTIADTDYPIRDKGDYRMVLDCFNALNDEQLSHENRLITALLIFYDNVKGIEDLSVMFGTDLQEPCEKMIEFFNCGKTNAIGASTNYKLVDWEQDSQLIAAAVNNVAGKELRSEPYLHWWTFMGYYQSVGECTLSTVVGIRQKIKKGKTLEKYEKEFKKDNPQYFVWDSRTDADKDAMDWVTSMWGNGG